MRRPAQFVLALLSAFTISAEMPKLIPRDVLFRTPARGEPSLSPDGKRLAFLAPDDNGVANIWVMPMEGGTATQLTREPRPVQEHAWSGDGKYVLYETDDGDENAHVLSVDLANGNIRDLTPFRGVRTQRLVVNPKHPRDILVDLNLRDRKVFDVHRVNLETGAITLEATNPGDVNSWITDNDFVTRAATAYDANGNTIVRVRDDARAPWRDLVVMPFERAPFMGQIASGSVIAGFAPDGKSLYVASALHSDTARIERVDAKSGEMLEVVAEHPKADSGDQTPEVMLDPNTGAIQAVKFDYLREEWRFVDPRVKEDMELLAARTGRFIEVTSRSADDERWIVAAETDVAPNRYYTYDRATKKLSLLFDEGEHLAGYTLAEIKPVIIKARDGMELVSYLTIPPGTSGKNLPTIIFPHGGPWDRDWIGWYPELQFLVNRGFAVVQVNHRGSTGLGIGYYNAGNGQVGTGMVDDYVDAARWAVAQGIADPKKLVLYGGSMGGYDTLRLLTREPDLFAAGVAIVPIAELRNALDAFPPYWVAARSRWERRIGGNIMKDDARNRSLSPLYDVEKIKRPLFVAAGGHDVRARAEQIEQFVKSMRDAKRDVTYVLYPDEGHGFARPDNNMDMYGRIEEFLAKHVGTRAEPWKKIEGSSAEVR